MSADSSLPIHSGTPAGYPTRAASQAPPRETSVDLPKETLVCTPPPDLNISATDALRAQAQAAPAQTGRLSEEHLQHIRARLGDAAISGLDDWRVSEAKEFLSDGRETTAFGSANAGEIALDSLNALDSHNFPTALNLPSALYRITAVRWKLETPCESGVFTLKLTDHWNRQELTFDTNQGTTELDSTWFYGWDGDDVAHTETITMDKDGLITTPAG